MSKITDEQRAVIEHQGNARVNAVAGSGKTWTLLNYAKARPNARMLYVAYNKSVKDEAVHKFKKSGVENVTVETAHSLAYSEIMRTGGYTLSQAGNLRPQDVLNHCRISQDEGRGLVLAKHVIDCLTLFCNNDKERIHHVDYSGGVDVASKQYAAKHLDVIYGHAKSILNAMYDGEMEMTHDVYLKLFQLQHPKLPYTHLLFDEGQDANPCMLDIFKNQSATKIIVGDTFQSIYSFNGAVNSLEMLDYPLFRLTNSFRFGPPVAKIAMDCLNLKQLLGQSLGGFNVKGCGSEPLHAQNLGIIARSNLGLLQLAIEWICEDNRKAAFEGGLRGYSCLSGGGGLFDVLDIFLGRPERPAKKSAAPLKVFEKDPFYESFKNFDALSEYQEATSDRDLGLMLGVVKQYGSSLFPLLKKIKENQVPREKADIVFSSVHRSKGQEYGKVILASDFIHGKKLLSQLGGGGKRGRDGAPPNIQELSDEINILYVGVTRTKGEIEIPFDILPEEIKLPKSGTH